jgi:20S proteasome subunit beta 1
MTTKEELLAMDPLHNLERYGFGSSTAGADPKTPNEGPISMGTTLIAVTYEGGAILAADSRTSTGSYVANRVSNKLTKLCDNIYCGRSGSAADTQAMAEAVAHYLKQKEMIDGQQPPVVTAARVMQTLCYRYRFQISAGILVVGYDAINGGQVYSVPLGGALLSLDYAMGGSGSTYLYGWADQNFKKGMTRDQALNFVREAVSHAISRDGSSGGVIRSIIIDKNGVQPETIPWGKIPYCMERDPNYSVLARQNVPWTSTSKRVPNKARSTEENK